MIDLEEFKKTFSKEQEDALWQYFIDHSRITKTGFWTIEFNVRGMEDFWRRVYARFSGDFKRYDKLKKEHLQQMQAYWWMVRDNAKKQKIVSGIDKGNDLWKKFVLFLYRKTKDYLFN